MDKDHSNTLVVGAGISGIKTALDLAQQGHHVTLIDRHPAMGGILSQLDFQFPSNHCGMCKLLPLVDRDKGSQYCLRKGVFHENITLKLSCEMTGLSGEAGNFIVRLRQKPTWVDPNRCVGCGLCEQVCPIEVPDCFNERLSNRKAIYLPVPHAVPNAYVIDLAACSHCGECEAVCPADAIQLSQSSRKDFHILVVDDELSIRDSLKEWLEEEDFSVDMAASGIQAIAMLKDKTYALMLTDIKMPEMDGTELLKLVKSESPDLTVVMMTAYATVETAVEAMKIGALDYLVKPFDPQSLIPMVVRIYQDTEASKDMELNVDSVVLSCGTTFYNPADERNLFGYGIYPNVMTHIEFERLLSHTGPSGGKLLRMDNSEPVKKIAWLQCVGSRDVQAQADYCSTICCMIAVKEAVLASDLNIDTTVFYMDMRVFGKSFQQYYNTAKNEKNVRFIRCKIHSLFMDNESKDLELAYIGSGGELCRECFDMVVLSTGQRPGHRAARLAELCGIDLNNWGFIQTHPFFPSLTTKPGVFAGGSVAGFKDISESLIHASCASLNASKITITAGHISELQKDDAFECKDVSRDPVRICAVVCSCGHRLHQVTNADALKREILDDPMVEHVIMADRLCTAQGFEKMADSLKTKDTNRVLIGACHPYVFQAKIKCLARDMNLSPFLFHAADISKIIWDSDSKEQGRDKNSILPALQQGCAVLKHVQPCPPVHIRVTQRALIVGGGIAGMTAALAIADHGFEVDLVEKQDQLGGNLNWLTHTLEKRAFDPLLNDTRSRLLQHPKVNVFTQSAVLDVAGRAGCFTTMIEDDQNQLLSREHGAIILATGGMEAPVHSYATDTHEGIVTQKELEVKYTDESFDAISLNTVVMILCVDSRSETKNYCSRVCCPTALRQARTLKEKNPNIDIYILYRDMMTCGFSETHFTQARNENILFISYEPDEMPRIETHPGDDVSNKVLVKTREPVLDLPLEIEADLVVLATGILPQWPEELAAGMNIEKDDHGFFKEADSKWRPMDAITEGVYACGLVHSPRPVNETIATAEAAASRALTLISKPVHCSAQTTAVVRHSLCSRCQRCIPVCPYGARQLDMDNDKIHVSPIMCQGCGACAAACPNGAAVMEGYSSRQMMAQIDAAMERMPN